MANNLWWKEAVVYQIYPRSFKDSNGDGVGDLRGVMQKLDYIQSLGVDAVWINPFFKSPNDDGGYDISDYYDIQPEFGTMDDFDKLLDGLHKRGIRLIMDLVLNHSSDEHMWFQQSRKSKDNPYRDFYFWRDGVNGGPPNNWPSFFGGSAWQVDELTGQYYLHLFSRKQPDLNWENKQLRDELKKIMRFWLNKGVDGFRLDVISTISKRVDFPDTETNDFNETIRKYYSGGPRLREFIAEMRRDVWAHYPVMTVGEGPGITPQNVEEYTHEQGGLDMIFHFGHMFMDQGAGGRFDPVVWSREEFKEIFLKWNQALEKRGWGSVFLGNHDFARMVSRWGDDKMYWEKSGKLLLTLLLSMRGTPFIFQGDEIGMTNMVLKSVVDSRDIETHNGWREAAMRGMTEADFLVRANYAGRDNARTPMQWNDEANAGFSTQQPWMAVNENAPHINVRRQETDEASILHYFRRMVKVRKESKALRYGGLVHIPTGHADLFVYERNHDEESVRVILNFSSEPMEIPMPLKWKSEDIIISNYDSPHTALRPWECVICKS